MSPVILFGVIAINLALIAYTVGIVGVRRHGRVTSLVLRAFSAAVVFDVVATGCMVAGSKNSWLSVHGVVGYLALMVMVVVVVRLWKLHGQGPDTVIPAGMRSFLRFAYVGWLIAYVIGVALAARH